MLPTIANKNQINLKEMLFASWYEQFKKDLNTNHFVYINAITIYISHTFDNQINSMNFALFSTKCIFVYFDRTEDFFLMVLRIK